MPEQPYDPAANPYPAHRYHAEHDKTPVANAEEEAALGPGWFDSPNIHERLLLKYGESSESQARRKGDIERACDAFDQRLEKRVCEEQLLEDNPSVCRIAAGSLEEELQRLVSDVIDIYLRDWAECGQDVDSQEGTWFRKSFVGSRSADNSVRTLVRNKLLRLKQGYGKQLPPREKVDQRCEQLDKVGILVLDWAREQPFPVEVVSEVGFAGNVDLEIQDRQARRKTKKRFPSPDGLRWGEVRLAFTSDQVIKVRARQQLEEYRFDQIGFKDERTRGKPNRLWLFLQALTAKPGGVSWEDLSGIGMNPSQVQSNVKRLRQILCEFMGIKDDPFYSYRKVKAYRPKFTITGDASVLLKSEDEGSESDLESVYKEETNRPR